MIEGLRKIGGAFSESLEHKCSGIFLSSPGKGIKLLTILVYRHTEKGTFYYNEISGSRGIEDRTIFGIGISGN